MTYSMLQNFKDVCFYLACSQTTGPAGLGPRSKNRNLKNRLPFLSFHLFEVKFHRQVSRWISIKTISMVHIKKVGKSQLFFKTLDSRHVSEQSTIVFMENPSNFFLSLALFFSRIMIISSGSRFGASEAIAWFS